MGSKTLLLAHRTISLTGHNRQRKDTVFVSPKKKKKTNPTRKTPKMERVFRNSVTKQIFVNITDGIAA